MIELQTLKALLLHSGSNKSNASSSALQLSPIKVDEAYCKEWNQDATDFVVLTRNGELISNSLYRVGAFEPNLSQNYFMLIKYVEAIYDFDFIKKCYPKKNNKELELARKHLEVRWCIFDKNGVEKKEFKQFQSVYIQNGSCIYSLDSNYYHIETGELYCNSSHSMESSEHIFLDNSFDKDPARRGIMKINKKDGSWELFPKKD